MLRDAQGVVCHARAPANVAEHQNMGRHLGPFLPCRHAQVHRRVKDKESHTCYQRRDTDNKNTNQDQRHDGRCTIVYLDRQVAAVSWAGDARKSTGTR